MDKSCRVKSIDRAVAILKVFSENKRELKLSDISEYTGLNKSTVHGIISTLKYHGLIDQDEDTQKYRLGLYIMELGELVTNSIDVRTIGYPIVEEASQILEETAHVGVLGNMDIVYVDKKECDKSIKISTKIGSRRLACQTADGRILLAYLDYDEQIKRIPNNLEKHTKNTLTTKAEITKELFKIRQNGYAIDNEENIEGLICVAAPILKHNKVPKYSISVIGSAIRMNAEKLEETIRVVKEATMKISYAIGYKD